MKTKQEIQAIIRNSFGGTDSYHKMYPKIILTDGVLRVCQAAECFWFMDIINSYQHDRRITSDEMLRGMQFWSLKVNTTTNKGTAILERDSDDVVLTQKIDFTDFPLEEFKVYYSPMEGIVCLPEEY